MLGLGVALGAVLGAGVLLGDVLVLGVVLGAVLGVVLGAVLVLEAMLRSVLVLRDSPYEATSGGPAPSRLSDFADRCEMSLVWFELRCTLPTTASSLSIFCSLAIFTSTVNEEELTADDTGRKRSVLALSS